jgi:hypothetical protein
LSIFKPSGKLGGSENAVKQAFSSQVEALGGSENAVSLKI